VFVLTSTSQSFTSNEFGEAILRGLFQS